MPLFLYYKKVLNTPMFYLSEYFEKNREEYYENLQGISRNNDWENWIKFFLVAVEKQSEINTKKVESILNIYNKIKEKVIDIPTPKNFIKVLDFIFSMPIFDFGDFMESTGIKKDSGFRILKFLSDEKIVSDNGRSRDKTYFFDNLIKIIM